MTADPERDELGAAMRRINRAWLERRPTELAALVHPGVVIRPPGFGERTAGAAQLVAGFVDFCENAVVRRFDEADHHLDLVGATGVVSYAFVMEYEYAGRVRRSTGRDLWVFQRDGAEWLAVWRTMLDVQDEEVVPGAAGEEP